jgi:hypothetical protein
MKLRDIIIFSCIFVFASLYSVRVVVQTLTNYDLNPQLLQRLTSNKSEVFEANTTCTSEGALTTLSGSNEPHLQKLQEYQEACGSFVTNSLMVFTDMPKDDRDAVSRATRLAETLRAFKAAGVTPLVIVEPVSDWGLIDFTEFGNGFYDTWINRYFQELRNLGLTDADLGTWVPFPEANLPYWNNKNATPADFSAVVNRYLRILKQYYPTTPGSVLLNSATYDTNDFEWSNGEYISLRPYLIGIDKNLVQSFGLQGFSWMPKATQTGPGVFNAAEYLNAKMAIEAAETLGVKKIWYNTGSFERKYTLDEQFTVNLSPGRRKDVLNGIIAQAKKTQAAGYSVSINLFAEDKSNVAEATDWSYWQQGQYKASEHTVVLTSFVRQLSEAQIGLSLFDIKK